VPPTIRKATPDDAAFLVRVIDMASEGFMPTLWDAMAPDGADGFAVGLAQVAAEDGEFSHRHGYVLEADGAALGGMIGYPLPATPAPAEPDIPDAFVAVQELVNLAPRHWYINIIAVVPERRGQGLGTALLNAAEARARDSGCPGLALVVAASNTGAVRKYQRAGFREQARRPFDLSDFGVEPTDAILMVKGLS